jgi:LacI family transcriptional regulator
LIHHLTASPKPLALFAIRDIEAVEAIEACLSADLSVPEQISILGADNSETICDCLRVPLSSIDNNLEQVGYEGAALLERLISGESPPTSPIYIPPSGVVERCSTDCMAVNHSGVAAALQYIKENAHLPICMTDVVRYVAMSRSGLEKAFREHFVRAPMEELRHVRFERARKMLRETDEKIVTVARVTGFQTSHNLCRAFSQNLGLTPKQYRLKHRDTPV